MADPYWDEIVEPAPGSLAAAAGLRMTRRQIYEETTGRLVPEPGQGLLQPAPMRSHADYAKDAEATAKAWMSRGARNEEGKP